MTYNDFLFLNQFIPLLAFGWLMYRTVLSWPAEWAKPNHQWHYRLLLLTLSTYVALSSLGAIVHEARGGEASIVSILYFVQSFAVIALCALWPLGTKKRKVAEIVEITKTEVRVPDGPLR